MLEQKFKTPEAKYIIAGSKTNNAAVPASTRTTATARASGFVNNKIAPAPSASKPAIASITPKAISPRPQRSNDTVFTVSSIFCESTPRIDNIPLQNFISTAERINNGITINARATAPIAIVLMTSPSNPLF